jgi:TRAP-type C4-dicarboxylate transport system permease large subunit
MLGYFTPSEAAAVGTFAVLVLAVFQRDMTLSRYMMSLTQSIRTAVMLLFLVAGSTVLGHFIAITNIPQIGADWIAGLPWNRYLIMGMISLIYIIGGSFIDDLAFLILATPIFFPAVLKLGFNPVWFCIMLGVVAMVGVVIPPVAICVFVVKNITKVPMTTIYKGVTPFLIALTVAWVLLFIFPQLALWLPSVVYGT